MCIAKRNVKNYLFSPFNHEDRTGFLSSGKSVGFYKNKKRFARENFTFVIFILLRFILIILFPVFYNYITYKYQRIIDIELIDALFNN